MQHVSQSRRHGNLSFRRLERLTEDEAYETLLQIRFAENGGRPICPYCACEDLTHNQLLRKFRCRICRRTFTVTSGTIWAYNKLPFVVLLRLVAEFVVSPRGRASIEVSRKLQLSPTTAWVALQKLREVMEFESERAILVGIIEADSCFVGGWVRLHVVKKLRRMTDMRKVSREKRKVVCAVRERGGRVLIQVLPNESAFADFIRARVQAQSELHTDAAATWEKLGDTFVVRTINHDKLYWTKSASTNSVENFFRRIRDIQRTHTHISGNYVDLYAWETAFRATHCKMSDAERYLLVLSTVFKHKPSARFVGYWQRRRRR